MSRLKDRLLNYHIQVKKFADDDQMILANDVLSMIEQLQERGLTLGTVSATCRLEQLPAEEPQPESKNKSNQPLQPLVPRY